ncbi:MAG: class I tRNA ligase family protein [Minisyncoccota bacterium]
MTERNEKEPKGDQKKSAIAEKEEATLACWQDGRIFEKTLKQTEGGEPFVFYDGPPFATGEPHYGHLLTSIMKDAVPRYQTMCGRYVRRVWGWDCHGLPVENLVEQQLGLEHKKDIVAMGIGKFNEAARASVMRFDTEWKKIIPRIGRWINMEESYKTMDAPYTESIWWAFKKLHEKGLVYKDYQSMHICPRCETTLSTTEVADGYKEVTDISVTVKFELVDEPGTYVLAWTTTPWTLPGNVALAVGEEIEYVKVKVIKKIPIVTEALEHGVPFGGIQKPENFILTNERFLELTEFFKKEYSKYEIIEKLKGKDLVGKSYKPMLDYFVDKKDLENRENGWKIYAADFVTTESGTGVVHIAPAFGEDDMNLGKQERLPFVQHVAFDGRFTNEVKDFSGMYVKPKENPQATDIEIIKHLAHAGALFSKEKITHSYPHCWRCDTPLLNYATSSWFIKVTALKEKLLEVNKDISWIPASIKEGRFGKWLENAHDWSISRTRFWGAPLPVWECDTCEKREVVGTFAELKEKNPPRNTYIVMRHGEAESNVKGVVNGDETTENHLTEKGKLQVTKTVENVLEKTKVNYIFASPFVRTKETAKIVANAIGIDPNDIHYDNRLREVNCGVLEGTSVEVYRGYFFSRRERFSKKPEGGENISEVKRRVMDFLYEIEKEYSGKNILIITHEVPLWMIMAGAQGADVEKSLELWESPTGEAIETGSARKVDFTPLPHNADYELDVHRPYIDAIELSCACGGVMKRIPEVFDCWVESGSMPFAQFHYTGDDASPEGKLFRNNFPADFISEGLDQTRGWFYTMLVMGVGLFGEAPYKSAIVNGLILAEDGRKMSKRLKNYPDIADMVNTYGADAMRLYMLSSPIVHGEDLSFSPRGVDEVLKKVIMRTENVLAFYALHCDSSVTASDRSVAVLDQWIIARLAQTKEAIEEGFENYELDRAARPVGIFVDDLSTWYVRRSRERFKSDDAHDAQNAKATLRFVLMEFAKLIAPLMPFLAERVYAAAGGENESVHLEAWPLEKKCDHAILDDMAEVRRIVSLGLEARAKAGIKVRQPLAKLKIKREKGKMEPELTALIADEVNVKSAVFDEAIDADVVLDTTITEELRQEGMARDVMRAVQDVRKKAGMNPSDHIILALDVPEKWHAALVAHYDEFARVTLAREIEYKRLPDAEEVRIDDVTVRIAISKA